MIDRVPDGISHTARSLLAFFGTLAEWGEQSVTIQHNASPALRELATAILELVPSAWIPYASAGLNAPDGYVVLPQPQSDPAKASWGSYDRSMSVHNLPRPAAYVTPDPGIAHQTAIDRAVVAALVGLASGEVLAMTEEEMEDIAQVGQASRQRILGAPFVNSSSEAGEVVGAGEVRQ